jgi:hypothetical protein
VEARLSPNGGLGMAHRVSGRAPRCLSNHPRALGWAPPDKLVPDSIQHLIEVPDIG